MAFARTACVLLLVAQRCLAAEDGAPAGDAAAKGDGAGEELASLLQQPPLVQLMEEAQGAATTAAAPHIIALRRESVPVYRQGKVASFKTSYSGILNVGSPAQEFRVVFDTGSGHVVLPAAECKSEACLVHRRYNMTASESAVAINSDGSFVPEGELCDQVTIGFGTGEITGEFARDRVCLPNRAEDALVPADHAVAEPSPDGAGAGAEPLCVEMAVVLAVEMSTQPFKSFHFDGILGLGLDGLALNKDFSWFDMIFRNGRTSAPHFGVFLTEGEDGEESEIAFGGVNEKRLLEPLSWAPVAMADLGYWQVEIVAVRINGVTLDVCKDGTCRGVVDTGTSHFGVPAPYDKEVAELLTRPAGDMLDCRLAEAPEVQIELPGYNMTLHPGNYMRRLPLREGVSVGSAQGVYLPSNETNATLDPAPAPAPAPGASVAQGNGTTENAPVNASGPTDDADVRRFCRPRLMPVRLPAPLGPKLFILGEPVLHRYYTVYDWGQHRVGFGLANNRRNTRDPDEIVDRRGSLPKEVDMLLMQTRTRRQRAAGLPGTADSPAEELQEETLLVQVRVRLAPRFRRTAMAY